VRKRIVLPNFVEVSYEGSGESRSLDETIITLASKYLGNTSDLDFSGDKRRLEFLFPHFEQASSFTAELRVLFPQVAVDRVA